jgi:Transposase DNA-binding/Transposase Tn5 dimerisation domain
MGCAKASQWSEIMVSQWAQMEVASANLGDERLDTRLCVLLSALGDRPNLSIPAACGGHADTQAAYRFFDNPKVTFEQILSPHYKQTLLRMSQQEVALLVQDTTEVELNRPKQEIVGVGELDGSRRGLLLHAMHAFGADGTPLGTLWAEYINRIEGVSHDSARHKREQRKQKPLEEKESLRWITALQQARQAALALPEVVCVCIADSEADIYEWFAEPRVESDESSSLPGDTPQLHWLVRACQDRALQIQTTDGKTELCQRHLQDQVRSSAVLYEADFLIRARDAKTAVERRSRRVAREARQAKVQVRAATVTLRPPWRFDRQLPPVTVNVVLVSEIKPPKGEPPVQWVLVTTLPINTLDQVRQIVEYYCVRWNIEILFRTLKSGCRIEHRRFEQVDRILPCMALYLIVAWRTLFVCRMGRSYPDADCEIIFEPEEWKAVWMAVHRKKPPKKNPRLREMVHLIAGLGGYVERPSSEPGAQTIWIGLQRMHDLAAAWKIFGPETRIKRC